MVWGLLLLQIVLKYKTTDELMAELFFPGIIEKEFRNCTAENSTSVAADLLFPGLVSSNDDVESPSVNSDENREYHLQEWEMEALAEENNQYEMLEALAEQELARQQMDQETTEESAEADVQYIAEGDEGVQSVSNSNIQPAGIVYERTSLLDYQFLINNFYVIDSSTSCNASVLQPEVLIDRNLTMDLSGNDPKILIYHTHSQESFKDSVPGDENGTVVGLGNTLTEILQKKYGVAVYHDKGTYDVINGELDRGEAYSMALPVVESLLETYPTIQVVIDLHRDGVGENTRLATMVNVKPTAKIMFFNGLCRNASGTNGFIQNPYLTDNLAFSLQMQLKAAAMYPDFTRRIYLRSYRFNMHVAPRTLLVECGAQTNTVEEAQNAMEPLADILYSVLSGT